MLGRDNLRHDNKMSHLFFFSCFMRRFLFTLCICLFSFISGTALYGQIDADRVVLMGRNALSVDDYLTAIRLFNQAIEAKPFLSRPYYYRGYAKFTLEDYAGAVDDCSKSISLNPYIAEVYQLRGLSYIRLGKYAEAVEDYNVTLREHPEDQGARFNRALCFLELDSLSAADADLDFMIRRWPNFYRAYLAKTQVCFERKDTLGAVALLDTILLKNPREGDAWRLKGFLAMQNENYTEADSCLSEALRFQPHNHDLFVARAQARHALDRFGDAIADYDQALALVPEHFVAHYNRGLLRSFVGDYNKAISDFDFVLKKEPDNTLALYNRAELRAKTGDHRGAIADYGTILKDFPDFMQGYLARAESRRKIGDEDGALRDETYVARKNLDIAFARTKKTRSKKVRRRSEHALEQYAQLIEENADTTLLAGGNIFGKVQNDRAEEVPMQMFALALQTTHTKGYHSVGYIAEMGRLHPVDLPERRLYYSADIMKSEPTESEKDFKHLEEIRPQLQEADYALLASVIETSLYDYSSALNSTTKAMNLNKTALLPYLQRAYVLTRSATAETTEASVRKEYLKLALSDLKKAQQIAPQNAYVAYNQGCLLTLHNDRKAAVEAYSRAIGLDDRLAEAYFNRALLYHEAGEKEKAQADFGRAGEIGLYKAYAVMKQLSGKKKK